MNWFTQTYFGGASTERKQVLMEEHGGCSHVEQDIQKLAYVMYENDTWGREGHCVCEECYNKSQEEEANQEETCYDCKGIFRLGDMKVWKWYDFYPQQGDEPLYICKSCQTQPEHLDRVKRDREAMEREFEDLDRISLFDLDFD